MNYEDRVLLKLRRTYSKDETVAALIKKLKEAELEKGTIKSELDEITFYYERFKKRHTELNQERQMQVQREAIYKEQKKVISRQRQEIKDLKKELKNIYEGYTKLMLEIKNKPLLRSEILPPNFSEDNFKDLVREMVMYMLPKKEHDKDVIDTYVDTFVLIAEECSVFNKNNQTNNINPLKD